MSEAPRLVQIAVDDQDCQFFTTRVFLTIKTSSENISITLLQISLKFTNIEAPIGGESSSKRFWKNSSHCREILLQVKEIIASSCCYDNSDVIATL